MAQNAFSLVRLWAQAGSSLTPEVAALSTGCWEGHYGDVRLLQHMAVHARVLNIRQVECSQASYSCMGACICRRITDAKGSIECNGSVCQQLLPRIHQMHDQAQVPILSSALLEWHCHKEPMVHKQSCCLQVRVQYLT